MMNITRKQAQFLKAEFESLLTYLEGEKFRWQSYAQENYELSDVDMKDETSEAFIELNQCRDVIRRIRKKQKMYAEIQFKVKKFLSSPKKL
jgi:hypothetical protein